MLQASLDEIEEDAMDSMVDDDTSRFDRGGQRNPAGSMRSNATMIKKLPNNVVMSHRVGTE